MSLLILTWPTEPDGPKCIPVGPCRSPTLRPVRRRLALTATEPPLALSHEPLRRIPPGAVNVHGHVHDGTEATARHINLTVEQIDYAPIRLSEVLAEARERGRH